MPHAHTILPCLAMLLFHLPAAAQAEVTVDEAFDMTVEEFETRNTDDKVDALNHNLTVIHDYYMDNNKDEQAQCMLDRYQEVSDSGESVLLTRVVNGLAVARDDHYVSDVVLTVVEKNCPGGE